MGAAMARFVPLWSFVNVLALAKFIAHVSVESMYSLGWGASFFTMAQSSSFFFFFRRLSSLRLFSFLLDADFAVAAAAMAGPFI